MHPDTQAALEAIAKALGTTNRRNSRRSLRRQAQWGDMSNALIMLCVAIGLFAGTGIAGAVALLAHLI